DDRQAGLLRLAQHRVESLRVNLPAGVGQAPGRRIPIEKLPDHPRDAAEADVDAAVVVDADEGAGRREIVQANAHATLARKGPVEPPRGDRFEQREVVEAFAL